jgi:hypothetical protein
LYIDTDSSTFLWKTDCSVNGSMLCRQRTKFTFYDAFLSHARTNYSIVGSVEGLSSLYAAGRYDFFSNDRYSLRNNSKYGVLIDYVYQLKEKSPIRQNYIDFFLMGWNGSITDKWGNTYQTEFERFIVQNAVLGNLPSFTSWNKEYHNIPDNNTILNYYSSKKLSELTFSGRLTNVSYIYKGGYLSASQANILNMTSDGQVIYEEWSNGLRIYANLNRTGWWNVSVNGAMRNLPPNGLYAFIVNDSSFEECFNCDNTSTWVRTPTYIYLYPKNAQNVTFTFPENWYSGYSFYGDDSTNGRRLEFTPVEKSSYKTANPSILYMADNPAGDVPWWDINPWPHSSFWQAIGIVVLLWSIGISLYLWISKGEQ